MARDHDGITRVNFRHGYAVMCRCGWQGGWSRSQDDAEAEHELHAELDTLTAEDFAR